MKNRWERIGDVNVQNAITEVDINGRKWGDKEEDKQ